ncbi:hypothetical protein [Allocoleopsis sp.]|uniref:hypothetical protein n=1 Tax=Allocoleopsis sp. TaxID=3088169 RepID=UPI002FD1CB70
MPKINHRDCPISKNCDRSFGDALVCRGCRRVGNRTPKSLSGRGATTAGAFSEEIAPSINESVL